MTSSVLSGEATADCVTSSCRKALLKRSCVEVEVGFVLSSYRLVLKFEALVLLDEGEEGAFVMSPRFLECDVVPFLWACPTRDGLLRLGGGLKMKRKRE